MRVPKAGNNVEMAEEEEQEMIVEMERTGHVRQEREGVENTRLRDMEGKESEDEEDRRADKEVGLIDKSPCNNANHLLEVGQSGHLSLLIALLLCVALLAIGFLVKQVTHFLKLSPS